MFIIRNYKGLAKVFSAMVKFSISSICISNNHKALLSNYQEKARNIPEPRRAGEDLRDQSQAWGGMEERMPCWGTGG